MALTYRMRVRTPDLVFGQWWLVILAAAVGCLRDPIAAPVRRSIGSTPAAAKSSTALAVTSASPGFGHQGTTVDVHVFGSGFTAGAQATWLLNGVADSHVHTNSTTYVSSSELVANITIASDATLAFWDVQVSLSNGKNGVGSDLFEVTAAKVLAPATAVYGMSEDLKVAGYGGDAGGAFVIDDGAGAVSLGSGQAWSVDPLGTIVGGRDGNFVATAWVQQSPSTWIAEQLPTLPQSVGGNVSAAARTLDGTLIAAGWDLYSASTKRNAQQLSRVVLWQRSGDAWLAPVEYALPNGTTDGHAYGMNRLGQIVGVVNGKSMGAVWDNPTTSRLLDGTPNAINPAGTLIVGFRTTGPVPAYWWRSPSTGAWDTTSVALPSLAGPSCTTGVARAVNSTGIVVGWSCNSLGKGQATVWQLDLSGATPVLVAGPIGLSGLGSIGSSTDPGSSANAVTEGAPFTVAGTALENGQTFAVLWQLRSP